MQSNRIIIIQRRAKRRLLVLAIAATALVGYNAISLFAEDGRPIQPPVEKLSRVPGVKAVGIRIMNPSGKLPTRQEVTLSAPLLSLPIESLPTEGNGNLPNQNTPDGRSLESNPIVTGPDLVNIRVVQPRTMGQPSKMPPFVFEKSENKSDASSAQSTVESAQTKVRIAITDSSDKVEVSPQISNSRNVTQPKNRLPQLVKSKPTQIAHTVVLAQSTTLELQSTSDQTDEIVPPVQIDSSPGPHSIASGFVSLISKTAKKLEPAISQPVPDSLALHTVGARNEPQLFAKHTSTSSTTDSTDSMRRSFDSSLPNQSPLPTVELECLGATTMNLAGNLIAIAVQDENICKVLHNERTLSLVGNQSGTTLVQVWTTEPVRMPQVVRVNVSLPWGKTQATRSEVNDIKQVIAQGFPRADVKILNNEDGTCEVRGTTDSEESARRILELVRKLYLVPVKDRLTVSK